MLSSGMMNLENNQNINVEIILVLRRCTCDVVHVHSASLLPSVNILDDKLSIKIGISIVALHLHT